MVEVIKVQTLNNGAKTFEIDSNEVEFKKDFMGSDKGFYITRNGRFYRFVSRMNTWFEMMTLAEFILYVSEKMLDDDFIHLARTAKTHQNVRDIYSAYILSRD